MTPLITLTTDFGADSSYVAQMKAVLLDRIPAVRLVDVTHSIPPQDVLTAAQVLGDTLPWFPAGSVHTAVIDPGVGTERRIIAARMPSGFFVGPDNGIGSLCHLHDVVAVENPRFWLSEVSSTFHGRDIMVPVAAAIALGTPLIDLGPSVSDWITLSIPEPRRVGRQWLGEVVSVDHFGNLTSNITAAMLGCGASLPKDTSVAVDGDLVAAVSTYGEARSGDLVALIGSSGRLEIAVVNGNAESRLGRSVEIVAQASAHSSEKG